MVKGREVIPINRKLTLDELEQFMMEHWDRSRFGEFQRGKPTPASVEEYLILPATEKTVVIVYPRGGGALSRKNKVIVTVCDSALGASILAASSLPSENVFYNIAKTKVSWDRAREFRGVGADMVEAYAAYLGQLLAEAGLATS